MAVSNLIPSVGAGGRFEAEAPFNQVVDVNTYYTVTAVRTIAEMQSDKNDLYKLVFQPAGMNEQQGQDALVKAKQDGAVIVLIEAYNKPTVYVPSTYFKTFPLVDGVAYERMCMVVDLGPVPPEFSTIMEEVQQHIQQYVENKVGISSRVQLGTVPTIGYVSSTQHETNETTRKNKIKKTENDISRVKSLEDALVRSQNEVLRLEGILAAK